MTSLTPIFYTRGANPPYTEGHIQVIRTMIKSLSLCNVNSIVFNFRYRVESQKEKPESFGIRREQTVPFLSRDQTLSDEVPTALFASLAESVIGLNFIAAEKLLNSDCGHTVVNVVNSFRYLRALARGFLKSPIVLHFYMPRVIDSFFTRRIMKHADAVISSSNSVSSFLKTLGVDKDKISVVYPPVDTAIFESVQQETAKSKVGFPPEARILLYLGSLRANRFPEHIILNAMKKIVEEHDDAQLFIYAPVNRENKTRGIHITKRAAMLGLSKNVRMFNRNLGDFEKNLVYNASDILLFPAFSSEAIEPPLTVLEAMAVGLPVVCSDALSSAELFEGNMSRFLVPLEKMESSYWAEKISSLLDDCATRKNFSEQARQRVLSRASVDVTGPKLVKIFESLF